MQKFRKTAIICAAIALAAALIVAPTLSWLFTISDKVENSFEGGDIAIVLDESKVNPDGSVDPDTRVVKNDYHFVAGSELPKDPTLTVKKGTVLSYVFVDVENKYDDVFSTNVDTTKWYKLAEETGHTLYVYKNKVEAPDADLVLDPVFTKVTVSEDLTLERLHEMKEEGEKQFVNAQAYAIQAEVIEQNRAFDMAMEQFGYTDEATKYYVTVE